MDIDRYIAENDPSWQRLEQLSKRARRGARKLSAEELDELVHLYQRTSAQLAHVRTAYDDIGLINRLSRTLGLARGTIYRKRANPARAVTTFFTRSFPAAVWHSGRQLLIAALLLVLPAVGVGIWMSVSDGARNAAVPEEVQRLIAQREFADYYRSDAAANFQARVAANNIQVSFIAFAFGALLAVPTAFVLVTNGANIGLMAAVMHNAGEGPQFWGLITPHGLLELTAIAISGAAGLRLGWAVIAPGDRTRRAALADEGLRSVVIVMGLVVCFLVASFIEAFVTPSGLPTWARIATGALVEAAFLGYVIGFGRNAALAGLTGRLGEEPGPPPETRRRRERAEARLAAAKVTADLST